MTRLVSILPRLRLVGRHLVQIADPPRRSAGRPSTSRRTAPASPTGRRRGRRIGRRPGGQVSSATSCAVGAHSRKRGAVTLPVDPVRLLLRVLAVERVEHRRDLHPGAVLQLVAVVVLTDHDLALEQLLHLRVGRVQAQREIALQIREVADHRGRQPGRVVAQVVVPVAWIRSASTVMPASFERLQPPAHHPRLVGRRHRVGRPGEQTGLDPVRLGLGQVGRAGRLAHHDRRDRGRRVPAELHGESVGRDTERDVVTSSLPRRRS